VSIFAGVALREKTFTVDLFPHVEGSRAPWSCALTAGTCPLFITSTSSFYTSLLASSFSTPAGARLAGANNTKKKTNKTNK
jgi:hypothetical protein